jgi:hypothetical protein
MCAPSGAGSLVDGRGLWPGSWVHHTRSPHGPRTTLLLARELLALGRNQNRAADLVRAQWAVMELIAQDDAHRIEIEEERVVPARNGLRRAAPGLDRVLVERGDEGRSAWIGRGGAAAGGGWKVMRHGSYRQIAFRGPAAR